MHLRSLSLAALLTLSTLEASASPAQDLYREGLTHQRSGDEEKAIAAYEAAVKEKPDHALAWAALGYLYKKSGDFKRSIAAYQQATSHSPQSALLWSNLGMAHYRAGDKGAALAALYKSCRLDPTNAEVQANIGSIKLSLGRLEQAGRHFRVALRYKKDPITANNLGITYRKLKRFDKAERVLKLAVKLAPKQAESHFNLGVVYRHMEEFERAVEAYSEAVRLDPNYRKAWFDLAHVHRLNRNDAKAIYAFQSYYLLVKGSDAQAAEEAAAQIELLGGNVPTPKRR